MDGEKGARWWEGSARVRWWREWRSPCPVVTSRTQKNCRCVFVTGANIPFIRKRTCSRTTFLEKVTPSSGFVLRPKASPRLSIGTYQEADIIRDDISLIKSSDLSLLPWFVIWIGLLFQFCTLSKIPQVCEFFRRHVPFHYLYCRIHLYLYLA